MTKEPYSRDTFEEFAKIRHYVSVRLKQGVPIVDADINEMEDLRRYELRNFLRWFVGNGIPAKNDGFKIVAVTNQDNEVKITGGDDTPEGAGRCIVDGMEVINDSDICFSQQEFANESAAKRAGVALVKMPETPVDKERTDLYYLDVWDREITSEEDPKIVDKRIGIETTRRIRREWAVRVIDKEKGIPEDGLKDDRKYHYYYLLASVTRPGKVAQIKNDLIVDLRHRIVSRTDFDQIALDAFGDSYSIEPQNGLPHLAMSLRDVINAMLRHGHPTIGKACVFQTGNGTYYTPASTIDNDGNQWVFWLDKDKVGSAHKIYVQRQISGTWVSPVVAFKPAGNNWAGMDVTSTADNSIWLFYSAYVNNYWKILGRRFHNNAWEDEITVSRGNNNVNPATATVSDSNVMVVWRHQADSSQDNQYSVQSRQYIDGDAKSIVEAVPAGLANWIDLLVEKYDILRLYVVERPSAFSNPWLLKTKFWHKRNQKWASAYSDVTDLVTDLQRSIIYSFTAVHDCFDGKWFIWTTPRSGGYWGTSILLRYISKTNVITDFFPVTYTLHPDHPMAMRDANDNIQVFFSDVDGRELKYINIISEI